MVPITPMPIPAGEVRAGLGVMIAGGTFDPPHRAHVGLALAAREAVGKRVGGVGGVGGEPWLMLVPAARSPHKAKGPAASDAERVEMARLALEGVARASVWSDEVDRARVEGGPSFTVETLRRARAWLDGARGKQASARDEGGRGLRLMLLMGADQAVEFHRWREPGEILALAEPVVVLREPWGTRGALEAALRASGALSETEVERMMGGVVEVPLRTEAARDVRAWLASGEVEKAARALHPAVARYIAERGLYRGE